MCHPSTQFCGFEEHMDLARKHQAFMVAGNVVEPILTDVTEINKNAKPK
jgi:hypothetical protein